MGLTARVKCSFGGYLIATWIQHHIGVMKAQRCGESWQILSNKEVFFLKQTVTVGLKVYGYWQRFLLVCLCNGCTLAALKMAVKIAVIQKWFDNLCATRMDLKTKQSGCY